MASTSMHAHAISGSVILSLCRSTSRDVSRQRGKDMTRWDTFVERLRDRCHDTIDKACIIRKKDYLVKTSVDHPAAFTVGLV